MDLIYHPSNFNATKHIKIKEYFKQYSEVIAKLNKGNISANIKVNDLIFAGMEKDMKEKEKVDLCTSCSTDLLTVPGEMNIIENKTLHWYAPGSKSYTPFTVTEAAKKLKTMVQFLTIKNTEKNFNSANILGVYMDYQVPPKTTESIDLEPSKDIVIIARLFRPFEYACGMINTDPVKFEQEIKLLGSNTLADLRDKIGCCTQVAAATSFTEDLDEIEEMAAAENLYPSGFIFIDDVFYNDFREVGCIDYSEVIRAWAKDKSIGSFKTAEMKDTRLDSLTPRLGYPYVYQHQVRCEHLLIFSHMRLLKNDDPLSSTVYPYHSNASMQRSTMCLICGLNVGMWLIVECDRLPRDKAPLCTDCLSSYCYIDGRKVGTFNAYPLLVRVSVP